MVPGVKFIWTAFDRRQYSRECRLWASEKNEYGLCAEEASHTY